MDVDGNITGNVGVDEGTDGFHNIVDVLNNASGLWGMDNNDDGTPAVDDMGERETMPPYSAPLRGIQVRIRVYEPDSRSVREVTLRQNFVPE